MHACTSGRVTGRHWSGSSPMARRRRRSLPAHALCCSGRGFGTNAIQREARVSKPTVWRWQKAYMDGGVERLLKDKGKGPRAGKKPISAEVRLTIVTRTAKEKPKHATHWSARMMAAEIGVGHTTVQRDLEGAWPQAASDAPIQALERSKIRREGRRHRRALPQSARQGSRALRRREKPDSGARSHPTGPADKEGPCSDDDARLQTQWHDDVVRGARREDRQGHRRVPAAPPRQGVHPLPEEDRPGA